jgi:hypothetical protein
MPARHRVPLNDFELLIEQVVDGNHQKPVSTHKVLFQGSRKIQNLKRVKAGRMIFGYKSAACPAMIRMQHETG